jgi:hypothetical protein
LSGQPEDFLDSAVLLFRRIPPDAVDTVNNRPFHTAFRLRASRDEGSLSFYDASMVSPDDVLRGAPGPGWAIARVTVGTLTALGFTVARAPVALSGVLGQAHVAATPAGLINGQIPAPLRQALAFACELVNGASG